MGILNLFLNVLIRINDSVVTNQISDDVNWSMKEKSLKNDGSFDDTIKGSVSGNPKPKEKYIPSQKRIKALEIAYKNLQKKKDGKK